MEASSPSGGPEQEDDAGSPKKTSADSLLRPGLTMSTYEELKELLQEHMRQCNCKLRSNVREKTKGSGLVRGVFECHGANVQAATTDCKTSDKHSCHFCVPFTYNRADGSHVIKESTAGAVPRYFSLEHNHVLHSMTTVVRGDGEVATEKCLLQHLSPAEMQTLSTYAGTRFGIPKIQVNSAVIPL